MNKRIKRLLGSVFFGIWCVALTVVALLGAVMICSVRLLRPETLTPIVCRVADKVLRLRRNMTLEPMNAYERHVIHTALQGRADITTYSIGTEPNRRTVVADSPGENR